MTTDDDVNKRLINQLRETLDKHGRRSFVLSRILDNKLVFGGTDAKYQINTVLAMFERLAEDAARLVGDLRRLQTPLPALGTKCSICHEPQFQTPSGVSCANGHGGVDPLVETVMGLPLSERCECGRRPQDCTYTYDTQKGHYDRMSNSI